MAITVTSHLFLILYENTYKEKRVIIVEASSYSEAWDISFARGLKVLGVLNYNDAIKKSEEKTQEKRQRRKQ